MEMYSLAYDANKTFYVRHQDEDWFKSLLSYLTTRYRAVEDRFVDTFRYVDCNPSNANIFSYEYSSLLRDICGIFASTMHRIVKEAGDVNSTQTDMGDYRRWLLQEIEDLHLSVIEIEILEERRYLAPFEGLNCLCKSLPWWSAYTGLKHSDIDNSPKGNFKNCFNALAALATIYRLIYVYAEGHTKLFGKIHGIKEPEKIREILFFD